MHVALHIGSEPIDESGLARRRPALVEDGAVVVFLGVVRRMESDRPLRGITYEAFDAMARHQFTLLFEEAGRRWPISSIRLAHRTGFVATGDTSLWLEIIAPHRKEALDACGWIIDAMKQRVPIWKRPEWQGAEPA